MSAAAVPLPPAAGRHLAEDHMPMAAHLLPAATRTQVLSFFRFVSTAEEIADSHALSTEEKLARLDRLDNGLNGRALAAEAANHLRKAVEGDFALLGYAGQMLQAFRRDAVFGQCSTWADLLAYCRFAAVPIGRFLLTIHAEPPEAFAGADSLCMALQILHHIQACGREYRTLGRIHLPADRLMQAGIARDVLAGDRTPAELRQVLDEVLDSVDDLIDQARSVPDQLYGWRFRLATAAALTLAQRLSQRLRHADPLAAAVRPNMADMIRAGWAGLRQCVKAP